ncbi:MAG: HD domain-containing protein [Bacteroidia bacterium]|nr:HD domain-containing protein [Bacteroidia bacterium]
MKTKTNKRKIINDPIYGFVTLPDDLIYDLINHPYFQRLRRIKQLGMTNLVYPGALHTRFHHAIGAMYLMTEAVKVLQSKGIEITEEETRGVAIAILLHDIGHGPFSHSLELNIVEGIHHEDISSMLMERLNKFFKGQLTLAIKIFNNKYKKHFLHQLVSSQLDMDRLDYLKRDSFFTGVSEGVISTDRIIKMLNVVKDELVVESKGIYSIEKFIIARRLMYWQVYLHKTVLSAEKLLVNILKRAKELAGSGQILFASPPFALFLENSFTKKDFQNKPELLDSFVLLDDYDVFSAIKVWAWHDDKILSTLCKNMVDRNLYKIELQKEKFDKKRIKELQQKVCKKLKLTEKESEYFVFTGEVENRIYNASKVNINILFNNGKVTDIASASDQLNVDVLSKTITKRFLCYPK